MNVTESLASRLRSIVFSIFIHRIGGYLTRAPRKQQAMNDSAENHHRPAKESPALGAGQYSLGSGEGNSLTVGLTPGMNQRSIFRGRGSFLAIIGKGGAAELSCLTRRFPAPPTYTVNGQCSTGAAERGFACGIFRGNWHGDCSKGEMSRRCFGLLSMPMAP